MLKDIMQEDLALFFNPDEFGETHSIDGQSKVVVVDNESLLEENSKGVGGISKMEVLFYIKVSDLPGKPNTGSRMQFDNKSLKVIKCEESGFVFKIILGAFK